jgi:hypothetical protein
VAGDEILFEREGCIFCKDGSEIRVTERGGSDFYQEISWSRTRNRDILNLEGMVGLNISISSMDGDYLDDNSRFHSSL